MAVLTMDDSYGVCSRITLMYVPGHPGVAINETADSLASICKTSVPLQLYSADIKLLAKTKTQEETTVRLKISSEGTQYGVLHVRD